MKNYSHVIAYVREQVWAIRPEVLVQIVELVRGHVSGLRLSPEEVRERIGAEKADTVQALHAQQQTIGQRASQRGIAVVPVFGVIAQHSHMVNAISGPRGTSTEGLSQRLRAAMDDPSVESVILNVHSPGGSVFGLEELASQIRTARRQKPIVAVANSMAASAAYYVASSAGELSVTPGGMVGSIGTIMIHEDVSKLLEMEGVDITMISAGKFKTAGSPFEPLSDEARNIFQEEVDHFYDLFVSSVARGRGVPVAQVRSGFGEAKLVMAKDAVSQGMADRVESLEEVVERLSRTGKARGRSVATGAIVAIDETQEPSALVIDDSAAAAPIGDEPLGDDVIANVEPCPEVDVAVSGDSEPPESHKLADYDVTEEEEEELEAAARLHLIELK